MRALSVKIDEHVYEIEIEEPARSEAPYCVRINGETLRVSLPTAASEKEHWVLVEGRLYEILADSGLHWIFSGGQGHQVEVRETKSERFLPERRGGKLKAPIPGQVQKVLVQAGEDVCQGQTLVLLEAMKMLNELKAPRCGVIQAVNVAEGSNVKKGEVLIEIG